MAEALALRSAAILISSLNVQNVIIESDCKELVSCFNNAVNVQWDCEIAVNDAREFLRSVPAVSVCFAGRMMNKAADWLAKSCLKGMCPVDWVFRPPFPLELILARTMKDHRLCQKYWFMLTGLERTLLWEL